MVANPLLFHSLNQHIIQTQSKQICIYGWKKKRGKSINNLDSISNSSSIFIYDFIRCEPVKCYNEIAE